MKKSKTWKGSYDVVAARSKMGVRGGSLIFSMSKKEIQDLKNLQAIKNLLRHKSKLTKCWYY
jgi:hypothetical protein